MSTGKMDEYDFDSSDEEDIRNTVGNIPIQWYDSMAHLGYDTSGRPLMRPGLSSNSTDAIDQFLRETYTDSRDQSAAWRTVVNPLTGQTVILGDSDLNLIRNLSEGKGITGENVSTTEPWEEWFTKDVLQMPVTAHPPTKRSFIPSLLAKRQVGRMLYAMRMGWFKPKLPSWAIEDPSDPDQIRRYAAYMTSESLTAIDSDEEEQALGFSSAAAADVVFPDVWADQDQPSAKRDESASTWRASLPLALQNYRPPRPRPYQRPSEEALPGHIASYNPPPEFLLDKDEMKKVMKVWRDRVKDGHVSRIPPQMPQQFACLRHVPFSERYLREREERVKDLVMATRVEKQRLATTPESLLPQIPSLSQLRPYPSHLGLLYSGHRGRVSSLSVSPCGQWLASVSPADGTLRIWETATNYCFRCYQLASPILQRREVLRKSKKAAKKLHTSNVDGANETSDKVPDAEEDAYDSDEEWSFERPTAVVAWNPNRDLHLLVAAMGSTICLINPALGDRLQVSQTENMLDKWWSEHTAASTGETIGVEAKRQRMETESGDPEESTAEVGHKAIWSTKQTPSLDSIVGSKAKVIERRRFVIQLGQPIVDLSWHPKGDYFLSLSRPARTADVRSRSTSRLLLHRLSNMTSQSPFSGLTRTEEWCQAMFHPTGKPQLFILTPRQIRVFDLVQQKEVRCLRLDSGADRFSIMALHPSGDHAVGGTYDGRFNWFDIDLGNTAFKKLRLNHGAVRDADVHSCRPLVSVALDDGTILVVHTTVTDDLLSKPIIIPVHLIRTGQPSSLASVFSTVFHPFQPHLYSGGADGSVRQFVAWH